VKTRSVRIFLSSTELDLEKPRQNVIRYLGVLNSDVLAMEAFGSDESKPVDYSVKKVDECDMFIGIHAERYGTIDKDFGKSITELEYNHAYSMLLQGRLKALLIYHIASDAHWPLNFIERDPIAAASLKEFKKQVATRHTVTFFSDADDLPFLILRDVIRKLEVGEPHPLSVMEGKPVRLLTALQRPVGMEYYDESLAHFFLGRDSEIDSVVQKSLCHRLSLLIGPSGVGKTSLLCAGVTAQFHQLGWRVVIARPLQNPIENIRRSLWHQLFDGEIPKELEIPAVVKSAAAALGDAKLLVILDQFEDILSTKDQSVIEQLTGQLLSIYNSPVTNVRVLIAYRAEAEGSVGTIWQKISGAAEGLPRTYLGPLTRSGGHAALKGSLRALGLRIRPKAAANNFLDTLLADLETESQLNGYSGIYPPFIQMLLARLYADSRAKPYINPADYYKAGRTRAIIANYLLNQIQYLGNRAEVGKMLLIALVSSYGTKTQKTLSELGLECCLAEGKAAQILNLLVDLRLVRKISDLYEITHDFLARLISQELASAEEREAKTFKALLSSRAQAYDTTRSGLTTAEHLHIYRLRNKILCTEQEVRLLLQSHLAGNGPVKFWTARYQRATLKSWAEECAQDPRSDSRKAALRYFVKIGSPVTLSKLAEAFSDWKDQHELAHYIARFANRNDFELLLHLNRKKAEEIVRSSRLAIANLIAVSDDALFAFLAGSRSKNLTETFHAGALKACEEVDLAELRSWLKSGPRWRKAFAIVGLGKRGSETDLVALTNLLRRPRSKREKALATTAVAMLAIRSKNQAILCQLLVPSHKLVFGHALRAISGPTELVKPRELARYYDTFPFDVGRAIRECSTPEDLNFLRELLLRVELDPPARELVYAICNLGGPKEFRFLFQFFQACTEHIAFWNPLSVVSQVSHLATRRHLQMLKRVINSEEFWRYYREDERPRRAIPVGNYENLYFLKRLAAVSFGRVATRREWPTILKMLIHDYWVVRNAALGAVERVGRRTDLSRLIQECLARPTGANQGLIQALCILDELESG